MNFRLLVDVECCLDDGSLRRLRFPTVEMRLDHDAHVLQPQHQLLLWRLASLDLDKRLS
jgi:hypothetical protein